MNAFRRFLHFRVHLSTSARLSSSTLVGPCVFPAGVRFVPGLLMAVPSRSSRRATKIQISIRRIGLETP